MVYRWAGSGSIAGVWCEQMGGLVAGFAQRIFYFGNAICAQGSRWPVRINLCEKALRMSSLSEVSGVSVSFDGFKAIINLSFQIGAAELRAIISSHGAGKTTFMDIVTGKTRPDTGVVKWGDKSVDLLSLDEAQIAQARVGRKFQKPTVFEDQTVFENLLLALKNNRNVFRVLSCKRLESDHQKVTDLARDISLDSELHRLAGELEPWPEAMARGWHVTDAGSKTVSGK